MGRIVVTGVNEERAEKVITQLVRLGLEFKYEPRDETAADEVNTRQSQSFLSAKAVQRLTEQQDGTTDEKMPEKIVEILKQDEEQKTMQTEKQEEQKVLAAFTPQRKSTVESLELQVSKKKTEEQDRIVAITSQPTPQAKNDSPVDDNKLKKSPLLGPDVNRQILEVVHEETQQTGSSFSSPKFNTSPKLSTLSSELDLSASPANKINSSSQGTLSPTTPILSHVSSSSQLSVDHKLKPSQSQLMSMPFGSIPLSSLLSENKSQQPLSSSVKVSPSTSTPDTTSVSTGSAPYNTEELDDSGGVFVDIVNPREQPLALSAEVLSGSGNERSSGSTLSDYSNWEGQAPRMETSFAQESSFFAEHNQSHFGNQSFNTSRFFDSFNGETAAQENEGSFPRANISFGPGRRGNGFRGYNQRGNTGRGTWNGENYRGRNGRGSRPNNRGGNGQNNRRFDQQPPMYDGSGTFFPAQSRPCRQ